MTLTITDDELAAVVSELQAKLGDKGPPEIDELAKLTYVRKLSDITMLVGVLTSVDTALVSALATCLFLGCLVGRAQATRELLDTMYNIGDKKQ